MKKQSEIEEAVLSLSGMSCAACAARIEKAVGRMEGVSAVTVNLALHRATVCYSPSLTHLGQIESKIGQIGYGVVKSAAASPWPKAEQEEKQAKRLLLLAASVSLPLIWVMIAHLLGLQHRPAILFHPFIQLADATVVQFVIGRAFYARAYSALRHGSPNMDVLVVMSTSAAYFYSHYLTISALLHPRLHPVLMYDAGALIITVVLLGRWLEAKAKKHTLSALHRLYQLRPETVTLLQGKQPQKVLYQEVHPGDTVIVHPGERIPVDGIIRKGNSYVDESAMTGEPMPKHKISGDTVISGSMNQNGMLHLEVTQAGDEAALSRMILLMEDAQKSKAPIQRRADQISAVFVPVMIAIAFSAFAVWRFWLEPGSISIALERAISVLVAACPCALGLATPISILVGTGKAAELGIWFKEGRYLENLHHADTVILDKTGTLSLGRPRITDIHAVTLSVHEMLRLMAAAEQYSEHPLAVAFLQEINAEALPSVRQFSAEPGLGIRAVVDNRLIHAGSPGYLTQCGIRMQQPEKEIALKWQSEGKTVIAAAADGVCCGVISLSDPLRSHARYAVSRLKKMHREVALATGDHQAAAERAAASLGISRVYAGVSPEEKVRLIRSVQAAGHQVIMVGDGINDAPALAAADIGIAVGTGNDIAREAAAVNIIKPDVRSVADAILISRKTMHNIQQNLGFAFLYNSLTVPFAFMGFLKPWMAGTAMALSSVSVVLNALRLQRIRTGSGLSREHAPRFATRSEDDARTVKAIM